jgi:hypothetical protein
MGKQLVHNETAIVRRHLLNDSPGGRGSSRKMTDMKLDPAIQKRTCTKLSGMKKSTSRVLEPVTDGRMTQSLYLSRK